MSIDVETVPDLLAFTFMLVLAVIQIALFLLTVFMVIGMFATNANLFEAVVLILMELLMLAGILVLELPRRWLSGIYGGT